MILLATCGGVIGLVAGPLMLVPPPALGAGGQAVRAGDVRLAGSLIGCLPALAGFVVGWRRARSEPSGRADRQRGSLLARLGRSRFYCDALLFLFVVVWIRGLAQLARFIDWIFIDGFVAGAPTSFIESAAALLEPVQRRSARFYLASSAVGTGVLALLIVWLHH
jgi:NADH:ubiquinone oxidoreductase subunit 5 (subunit L)/multisubunit Na+/H+ antiporter MnhA subunit